MKAITLFLALVITVSASAQTQRKYGAISTKDTARNIGKEMIDSTLMLNDRILFIDSVLMLSNRSGRYLHKDGGTDTWWLNGRTRNNFLGDSTGRSATDSVLNTVGIGDRVLVSDTFGGQDVAVGTWIAPRLQRSGKFNTFIGAYIYPHQNGAFVSANTFIGTQVATTGTGSRVVENIAIGLSAMDAVDTGEYSVSMGRQNMATVKYVNASTSIGNEGMRFATRIRNSVGLGYKNLFRSGVIDSSTAVGVHAGSVSGSTIDKIAASHFFGCFGAGYAFTGEVRNMLMLGHLPGRNATTIDSSTIISGEGHTFPTQENNQLIVEDVLEGFKDRANRHMDIVNDTLNVYNDASLGLRVAGGNVRMPSLSGSGTRAVTADANGVLGSATLGTVTSVGLAVGTSGTDVNISGSPVNTSGTLTIHIPSATSLARGLVTTTNQTFGGVKTATGWVGSGGGGFISFTSAGDYPTSTGAYYVAWDGASKYYWTVTGIGRTYLNTDGVTSNPRPHASSASDVISTTYGTRPVPAMTQAQRDAINGGSFASWLQVICTDCTATDGSTGVLQIWNGSAWKNAW